MKRQTKLGESSSSRDTPALEYFSEDYFIAKARFLSAAERLGAAHESLPIDAPSPTGAPLTIDLALLGEPRPKSAIVLSSGVHGVEAYLGSAIQLAFLDRLASARRPPLGCSILLIHAVNPFGFAWNRRFNEENVDLNRNFLRAEESYSGAPPLCDVFRNALRPSARRVSMAPTAPRIGWLALRYGMRSLWETLPVGQYEYADWLFYGGSRMSQSAERLAAALPEILNDCGEVVHLDFHTGLGRWAECQLLLPEGDPRDTVDWWKRHFPKARVIEPKRIGASYQIRGGFGTWARSRFPDCHYRFATAEFGTYPPLRVIGALTKELHWHSLLGNREADHKARRRLARAFTPTSPQWRIRCLETGVALIQRSVEAPWEGASPAR